MHHACYPFLLLLAVSAGSNEPPATSPPSAVDERFDGPLPRWREGGPPADDPHQSLEPYALTRRTIQRAPTSGVITSPPEYADAAGVLFRYSSYAWPEVVRDCVVALTSDPAHDDIAYVIVQNETQRAAAYNQFAAGGADMTKVVFVIMPTDSIWIRDYGPHFIWQSAALAVVDSHYYPTRPLDNFIPTLLSDDHFMAPSYDIGLYYSGGNFQPAADGSGFVTTLINQDNSTHGEALIAELYHVYQGIEVLHVLPRLPVSVDATGHIDMWFYLVDEDTVIIAEFIPGSNPTAIEITENATEYMAALGYEVIRVPASNSYHPYDPYCHYTYTNAFRVNDRIFVPSYGSGNPVHLERDAAALAAWQAAAPEAEIIPIDSYDIIWAAGAIHCIIMQVPRYTAPAPAAHLVTPDGDELLGVGTTHNVMWAASDDDAVVAVDLVYSVDGGATYPYTIASDEPHDGNFAWTVPPTTSPEALLKVIAYDGEGQTHEALSASSFQVCQAPLTTYDFSTGAGQDKWAWGYQTTAWSVVGGTRHPAVLASEIDSLQANAYARIAASDAEGGDSDANRYVAPTPAYGQESTHVFEFIIAEDPDRILDIGVLWEGYGDACLQMEMYLWDHVRGRWSNGQGLFGENRYLDNWAGNRDAKLEAHVRSDFERYIEPDGRLTVLLYAERPGQESFHDYIAVTVIHAAAADLNLDGFVGSMDLALLLGAWGPCENCPADLDVDGVVDADDLALLLGGWG